MTTPTIDTPLAAWTKADSGADLNLRERRAALFHAAEQCAEDMRWLTGARGTVIRERLVHGALSTHPDFRYRFLRLVDATRNGFGPQIMTALDALVAVQPSS